MSYIVLLAALLALIAILAVVVYAYSKLPRPLFFLLLSALVVVPYLANEGDKRDFMLSFVPGALDVRSVAYSTDNGKDSWGLPGDETSGVRVYPLSEYMANEVTRQGIDFFKHLPPNQNQQSRKWRGIYTNWLETPVSQGRNWKPPEGRLKLNILDYLCGGEGLCIDIDRMLIDEVNEIINSPGSYYAYGRIGFIVVSPRTQRVFYLYNG